MDELIPSSWCFFKSRSWKSLQSDMIKTMWRQLRLLYTKTQTNRDFCTSLYNTVQIYVVFIKTIPITKNARILWTIYSLFLLITFPLLQRHMDLWVSHLFVHEDITWAHNVLWQDMFAHVSYPLSYSYAHTALSTTVSLVQREKTSKCTVIGKKREVTKKHSAWTLFCHMIKMRELNPEALHSGYRNIPKHKCCSLTTATFQTFFHLATQKDKILLCIRHLVYGLCAYRWT